ncbi:MAG: O-antigen ligase family protein [Bacteroidetes bacterium]|nr:O-antigen ligase family protein [Bacteroidota bacterium]
MQNPFLDNKQGIEIQIAFVLSCLLMAAFFVSPALMSISMGGILLVGIIHVKSLSEIIKSDKRLKILTLLFILFLVFHLFGLFLSDNFQEGQRKFFLKLPFLLSPFIWIVFFKFNKLQQNIILICFIFFTYLTGTISTLIYFQNQDYFDALIRAAKPMPIYFGYGIYHIQFSVLNAIACLSGLYLLVFQKANIQKFVFFAVLVFTVINITNLHVLSARTGLLAFYVAVFIFVLMYLKNEGKAKYLKFFPLLILFPIIAYFLSDSLQNRMANSLEDWDTIVHSKDANDKSVAMRVQAWKNGFALLQEHPIKGIGLGDVDTEMQRKYIERKTNLLEQNRKNPHNQFLETALQVGVVGALILFLIFVFYALVQQKRYIGFGILIILFVSMFFESLFERQVSVMAMTYFMAFFLFEHNNKGE